MSVKEVISDFCLRSVEVPGQGLPSYHKQLENRVKYMKQLFQASNNRQPRTVVSEKKQTNEVNPKIPALLPGGRF